jgi:hypothetical protein
MMYLKPYINNFSIFFDDIDVGRESLILIENSIKYCKDNKPNIGISGSTAEKQKWLIDKIQTVEFAQMKIEQKLRSTPNSKMLNYTIIEASPKKTTELIYDFKWEDMDANSVEFSILPQSLGIYVNTKNYAKVINFSKNGVVQNYTHRIYFEFSDVETCKKAFYVIQDLIKASQK